jgi:hypothetical protein
MQISELSCVHAPPSIHCKTKVSQKYPSYGWSYSIVIYNIKPSTAFKEYLKCKEFVINLQHGA